MFEVNGGVKDTSESHLDLPLLWKINRDIRILFYRYYVYLYSMRSYILS